MTGDIESTDDERLKRYMEFSEDFMRKKRNTLFWAGATAVIAIGTMGADSAIETSWAQNIALAPRVLLGISLLALAYAMIEFWHAEKRQRDEYRQLGTRPHVQKAGAAASELEAKLIECRDALALRIDSLRFVDPFGIGPRIQPMTVEVASSVDQMQSTFEEVMGAIAKFEAADPANFGYAGKAVAVRQRQRDHDFGQAVRLVQSRMQEIEDLARALPVADLNDFTPPDFVKAVERQFVEAKNACTSIPRWVTDMDDKEKRFHNLVQRWGTWLLVSLALAFALVRSVPCERLHAAVADFVHAEAPLTALEQLKTESKGRSIPHTTSPSISGGTQSSSTPSPALVPSSGR